MSPSCAKPVSLLAFCCLALTACSAGGREAGNPTDQDSSAAQSASDSMDAGAAEAGSDDASPAAPSTGERTGTKMTSASVKRACGSIAPSPLVDEAAKGETGARDILLSLAAAIEQRKFACAAALMDGAEGALDEEELNRLLDGPGKIWVAVPGGRMEGAAGSLYYEDDFRISLEKDGNREVLRTGKIVLRRVNDVPGATPEQLRWHVSRISFD